MEMIGKPVDRIDGRLKVTGAATYAAEFNQPNMVYAFPVRSTIAKGTITGFDKTAAAKSKGVITIITHDNAPRLKPFNQMDMIKAGGILLEELIPLQGNKVYYFGQFVAMVIAETYEQARYAAALIKVHYTKEKAAVNLKAELRNVFKPTKNSRGEEVQINTGKTASIIAASPFKIEHTYTTPTENHHPMEPHAAVAFWEDDTKVTIYDCTQAITGLRGVVSYLFNLKPENVRVISPFVGGGFGCKTPGPYNLLAIMAAQVAKRPAKLAITRQMMQTNVGRRAETIQKIALSAERNGKLTAIRHHNITYKNLSGFFEQSGIQTKSLYQSPIREITYELAKLNIGTPTFMRAPGETPGSFALESAMDEMANELKIDPVEFRILNHTKIDPITKNLFSSEYLLECYNKGAEIFGWNKRKMQPRSNRNGNYLVGYGMATATYPAFRSAASARVQMAADGTLKVMSATQDIGTGTYTIMAQTAAEALGISIEKITVELGDSTLPPAPISGGSVTTASVNPAVLSACELLRKSLLDLAVADTKSPLNGRKVEEIIFADAQFLLSNNNAVTDSYIGIMKRNGKAVIEACATTTPAEGSLGGPSSPPCIIAPVDTDENYETKKYSFHSFGAQFAEVWVDEDLGTIRVKNFTSVQDIGKVMNEKTARSQVIGGVIFGIGQALMEETVYDKRWGNPVVRTLADYHVPVNLDIPEIKVHFIGKPDPHISAIGARGVGEIGTTGAAAAIANAVFNATGKRLRDLPLTPEKLMFEDRKI